MKRTTLIMANEGIFYSKLYVKKWLFLKNYVKGARTLTSDDVIAPATDKLKYDDKLQLSNASYELSLSMLIHDDPNKSKRESIRNVAAYPQPYVFAQFAKLAYSDDLERRKGESEQSYQSRVGLPEGWSLLTMARNSGYSNGYVGAVFVNGKAHQIMIAHRGTKPGIGSFWTDLKSIYGNKYGAQMNSACSLAHLIATSLRKMNPTGKPFFSVFFTGHSLGGWLSQMTTLSLKYLTVVDKKFLKNADTQAGISAHTEIFESPGAMDMLVKVINDFDVRYSVSTINYDYLDIITYLSSPNQVNCCNSHVGKLYRIFPVVNTDSGIFFKYTIASHGIDGILKTFDPETGFFQKDESGNYKIKKVVDWPITYGTIYTSSTEYDAFFKWAKLRNNFSPEEDSASFKESVKESHGYVIRYQTKVYRGDKSSWNVFNRSEIEFLYTYSALRRLPEFYHPETLFEDDADHYIENKLLEISVSKRSVFYKVADHLRQLIPFVRALLGLYPDLATKANDALSSVEARKKIYQTLTKEYVAKLQPYVSIIKDVKFPELQSFLQKPNQYSSQNVLHISAEYDTDFVTSRIIKNITREDDQFNHFDLKFIMDLRDFMTIQKSFKLKDVLESDKIHNPIVVLNCAVASRHEYDDAVDLMKKLADFLKQSSKNYRIVLVSLEDTQFEFTKFIRSVGLEKLGERFLTIRNNGITWDVLTREAREDILNVDVISYQGLKKKVSFNYLFDDQERSKSYLDFHTLANVIKKVPIVIGKELPRNEDIEEFYIPRVLKKPKPQILSTVFENLQPKIKIVISGILHEELSQLNIDASTVTIIQSKEEYLSLVQSGFDVHWLNYETAGIFTLKDTTNLIKIRKYLELDRLRYENYPEDEILDLFDLAKNVTLADKAGTGKTSTVTVISRKIREKSPRKWVLRINFVDCTNAFKEAQNSVTLLELQKCIADFMTDKILSANESTKLRSHLEKQIFQDSLVKYGNLVLFFDGYDEIAPDYEDIAMNMLDALQKTKIDNIFVTSRRNTKKQLENTLNTLSIHFKPFTSENQSQFLIKFWKNNLAINTVPESELENYSKMVLDLFKNTNEEDNTDLLLVPLQCRLAGEFMLDIINNGEKEVLKNDISLLQLYESFVMKKMELYRKFRLPNEDTISRKNQNEILEILIRDAYYEYALELLLSNETRQSLKLIPQSRDLDLKNLLEAEVLKSGLMVYGAEKPQFIHRTVAEYFLFNYALNFRENDRDMEILSLEIMLKNGLLVVRSFYDNYAVKVNEINNKIQLPVFSPFVDPYFSFISSNWTTNKKRCLNQQEETALQVVLREGHEAIAINLVDRLSKSSGFNSLDVDSFVNNRDLNNGLIALHYASRYGFDDVINILITLGSRVNEDTGETWSPLHFAAMENKTTSGQILFQNGAKVDALYKRLMFTPLHLAAMNGSQEMVQLLIDNKANVMSKAINHSTPLHQAAVNSVNVQGIVGSINVLVKNGAQINAIDGDGSTPLHIATNAGILDIIESFLENGADINAKNNIGDTPMMTASYQETILYLIRKGADIFVVNNVGEIILHKAARYGYATVVQELLKRGVDVGIKNKQGEIPLDIAKKRGRENIIELLS